MEGQHFLIEESQVVNLERMTEIHNHHQESITVNIMPNAKISGGKFEEKQDINMDTFKVSFPRYLSIMKRKIVTLCGEIQQTEP